MTILLSLSWFVGAAAAADPCPAPASTNTILGLVEEVQNDYAALDAPALADAANRLDAALACLREPIPRPVAAGVHRAHGLRAFIDRDPEHATRAFAAARSIEPAWTFPDSVAPKGNPLWSTYEAIPMAAGKTATVPAAPAGYYLFDGRPVNDRPVSWPVIWQQVDTDGSVVATAYLWQGTPLPIAAPVSAEPPPVATASTPPAKADAGTALPPEPHGGPRWGLLGGGAASVVVAGVLYGLASSSHDAYYDSNTDPADKEGLRTRTNTLFVSSVGLAAVGLGCGAGSFLEVRW